jgi:hypothetical protein
MEKLSDSGPHSARAETSYPSEPACEVNATLARLSANKADPSGTTFPEGGRRAWMTVAGA